MLNLDAGALMYELGDPSAMTMRDVALVTEQTDASTGPDDGGELIELFLRVAGRDMRLVDAKEVIEAAAARRKPALFGCAERAQVQVAHAICIKPGGQLPFGKSWPARCGNRTCVHDQLNARAA